MESKNLSAFMKSVQFESKPVYLRDVDPDIGMKHFWSSCYIKPGRILVRGESNNPKANMRKAHIILNDPKNGKLKGNYC